MYLPTKRELLIHGNTAGLFSSSDPAMWAEYCCIFVVQGQRDLWVAVLGRPQIWST
ncbi:unnamed protein product, partial [Nesidiocoris tenuis]